MTPQLLTVRRIIRASREKVFAAWTTPDLLMKWWGPRGVTCAHAEIDLRPGGTYRLGNRHADGSTTWIFGVFELVHPPEALVYSWNIGLPGADGSRVRVEFRNHAVGTEVEVRHERLSETARGMHSEGWNGCLDGLGAFFEDGGEQTGGGNLS